VKREVIFFKVGKTIIWRFRKASQWDFGVKFRYHVQFVHVHLEEFKTFQNRPQNSQTIHENRYVREIGMNMLSAVCMAQEHKIKKILLY
jgi:hypothetical protein